MVFASPIFLGYFLPLVLGGYYLLPATGPARNRWLLGASYVFYGWWDPRLLPALLGLTFVAFHLARWLGREDLPESRRRLGLAAGVTLALLALVVGKYLGFIFDNYDRLASAAGWASAPTVRWALPLGISFFTFHAISTLVDIHRRQARPMGSLVDFACYLAFFPQLLAGPILRFGAFAPAFAERRHSLARAAAGFALLALGLAKKVLLADTLAPAADLAFGARTLDAPTAWFGLMAYALQIYFDFSGYSDMATGLARLFGFEFPRNFDAPYLAESLTDFWRRWHISLGGFLRDYLYIPLGGNRRGPVRTCLNLLLVMALGGLWHGPAWSFVAWGVWHGALLVVERWNGGRAWYEEWPRFLRVLATFALVLLGWVLFRAGSLAAAADYFVALGRFDGAADAPVRLLGAELFDAPRLLAMIAGLALMWSRRRAHTWSGQLTRGRAALCLLLLLWSLGALSGQRPSPFLYFQF